MVFRRFGITMVISLMLLTGCLGTPRAEVQAQVGLKNELQRIEATMGDIAATVARVDQSTHNYDAWTLRLQTVAPWLLGVLPLSYLSGKLVWIASRKAATAAYRRLDGAR